MFFLDPLKLEELADVEIMVRQVKSLFSDVVIDEIIEKKVKRQVRRIVLEEENAD